MASTSQGASRFRPAARTWALASRGFVAAVVLVIALMTLAQQVGHFGPWWLELSRYVPYPAVLAPAVAALLVSLRLGRRWFAASLAALALVLTIAMGFEWHSGDDGGVRVRVMTYNIKAYNAIKLRGGFAGLLREIERNDPDILVMQDANGLFGERTEPEWRPGPVFGLPEVYAAGQYVIASRYPLRDCGTRSLAEAGEELRYLRCTVDAHGTALNLVTAHLESPRRGLNAARREGLKGLDEWRVNYEIRRAQAAALARDLAGSARPLIVAGDLNAPESSPVLRSLLAIGLRDAYSSAGRGFGYSYGQALPVRVSFLRIDHVLVSPELGVAACHAGRPGASEHRPVIADLLLRRR